MSPAPGFACTETGDYRLPPGFDASNHPNRKKVPAAFLDPDLPTSLEQPWQLTEVLQKHFRDRGRALDQHGRPVHPHADQLLDRIGLNTGIGWGWRLGESVVADAVVTAGDRVLLWQPPLADGRWAVPGGYRIPGDDGLTDAHWNAGQRPISSEGILTTARRKVETEAGVLLGQGCSERIVPAIRPISSPHTINFWTVTFTVHFHLADTTVQPGPNAALIKTGDLAELPMWPDHRRAIAAVC